jgi:ubiquinone/menaquinone biosynthesis C-methylase UbiE
MDTLVRVEKEFIFDYLKEISRVLTKNGKAIIHLPNSDIQDCLNRNFTKLSTNEIINEVEKYFDNYILDSKTIVHGTLLKINIEE